MVPVKYTPLRFRVSRGNGVPFSDRQNYIRESTLAPLLEKFPAAAAMIRQLFQRSPSFNSLCDDYRDCLAAWRHWRQAASEDAPALCRSYAELLQELEEEVRQYLEREGG
jgi:hypothetical protein